MRALVSSFSRAVEVVTTPLHSTWTEQFRNPWMVPVSMVCLSRLRSKAVWQSQSLFYWTACGMEVDFSSDTACSAEQLHVLPGILLSALVCLTLMFDENLPAGAERFALVSSACFFCPFLLAIRREVKATVLGGHGGVWGHCVAVQRLMHGLVVWAFWADTGTGDPCRIQYCRAQWTKMWEHKVGEAAVLNHSLWSAGGQGWSESLLWTDAEVTPPHSNEIQNNLVLHILCGTEGKIFSLHSLSPSPSTPKFWMVHTSLRALWVVFPPCMPKPPHALDHSFGLFSATHSIRKWNAMKTFLTNGGKALSRKRIWGVTPLTVLCSWLVRWGSEQADGRFGLLKKTCFQSRADCPPSEAQGQPVFTLWGAMDRPQTLLRVCGDALEKHRKVVEGLQIVCKVFPACHWQK